METNGIEPSTPCVQSWLSADVVADIERLVEEGLLAEHRGEKHFFVGEVGNRMNQRAKTEEHARYRDNCARQQNVDVYENRK